ncbi:MAG: hypothetical protein ABIR66_04545 [Saprospiraceae bacterium]
MRDVLGFYDEWTEGNKDGGISRDELRLFLLKILIVIAINNEKHRMPLLWFVDNIDEIFTEFKERNIEIVDDLKVHPYRLRDFALIDINGYYIRLAEMIEK